MSVAALHMIKPMLIGSDPLQTETLWHAIYGKYREHGQKGPLVDALSAIDIALWDIKGKFFKQPIHRLLGGPVRTEVPVYATGLFRMQAGNPEEYLAEEAAGYVAQGFGAVKLKVGFGIEEDMRGIKAVRDAIGKDVMLMVDANEAYDTVSAIRLARLMEPFDIAWFEEPVPPEDLDGYVKLRSTTSIPIAGGEAEFTRYGFREILTRRAVDIIQPDICAAGGFSESKKLADMAYAFGVRCNPHTWGTAVAIAASLHFLAVLPDSPQALIPVPPMLELDHTEHAIRDALVTDVLRPKGGRIKIPEGHGLGIEIDRETVQRFQVE
jgi:D-galactarolactone cycloisomerase